MEATSELAGISVISLGSFNPAIFHPRWFGAKDLLPSNAVDHAVDAGSVVTPQLAVFTADWLTLQVTQEQAAVSSVQEGRDVDLRDIAVGMFDCLPETPVDAIGVNSDHHYRTEVSDVWHALGDRWLPKDFWEPLFEDGAWLRRDDGQAVGLRDLTVEVAREDERGFVRVNVAPSARVTPGGVYVGLNSHFQLSASRDDRGSGYQAARAIEEEWEGVRSMHSELTTNLLREA